jgi:parallel beta-helix repeat protein
MKPRRIFLTLCMAAGVTIVAAVLLVVGVPARAQGTSRYVSPTGTDFGLCNSTAYPCQTVQYAVARAAAGDTVKVAAGVYADLNNEGGLAQVVYVDKAVTIRGGYSAPGFAEPPDPEANPSRLDAGGGGRGIYVSGAVSVTLEGLEITGGDPTGLGGGPDGNDAGGGMYAVGATITLSRNEVFSNTTSAYGYGGGLALSNTQAAFVDNLITSNTATSGAGLYLEGGSATFEGNTFSSNYGYFSGGGAYLVRCDATLQENVFSDNWGAQYYGGGLYTEWSDVTLENNQFTGNISCIGGGMRLKGGSKAILENTFSDNVAADYGGGVYITGVSTMSHNTILRNEAFQGGGVYIGGGSTIFITNIISDNTAIEGGGLYLQQSNALVQDNTIHNNSADSGGGLYLQDSPATIHWNTIYSNTAAYSGGGVAVDGDSLATLTHNTIISNTAQGGGGGVALGNKRAFSENDVIGNTAQDGGGLMGACGGAAIDGNRFLENRAYGNGGGLYLSNSGCTVSNNIVADNQAGGEGSGLYLWHCTIFLRHMTIARNRGGEGSGVHWVGTDYRTLRMENTILVSHAVGVTGTTGTGWTGFYLEATLWGTGTWANETDWAVTGYLTTGTVNLWDDPGFVDFQAGDYHIGPGSGALDQGLDSEILADIDRQPRPYLAPDLGADEYWPPGVLNDSYLPLVVRGGP